MEFLYYLLWLIIAVAVSFALIALGLMFLSARKTFDNANALLNEMEPVIKELQFTLSSLNIELQRVEGVFEKVDLISRKINSAVETIENILKTPVSRLSGLTMGLRKAFEILTKGK